MAVNAAYPDYDTAAVEWARARDVLGGEDEVKAGGASRIGLLRLSRRFSAHRTRRHSSDSFAEPAFAIGLLARRRLFILTVPLAFNFRPELGATFGSQAVQVILQFPGICGDLVALKLLGGFVPLEVEGEEHCSSRSGARAL